MPRAGSEQEKQPQGEEQLLVLPLGEEEQDEEQQLVRKALESLPDTHFLVQEENYAFGELLRASSLPAFTTDRVQRRSGATEGRVAVPITDPGMSVDYFAAYRTADRRRLAAALKFIEGYA